MAALPPFLGDTVGSFSGEVKVVWAGKREMRVLERLLYVADGGTLWEAPEGSVVDGASIPRIFWRVVGSPFVGKFRRASVIHDVYCVTKSRPHKEVHAVFEEMMRVDGVGSFKCKFMAWAVKLFGPKW